MGGPERSEVHRVRVRRRAVGPPGSNPGRDEPTAAVAAPAPSPESDRADEERLLAERPPHHDRA